MKKTIHFITAVIILSAASNIVHAQSWNTVGNAGTNATTNFIGTTDNIAFKIRTKNLVRVTVSSAGKVGIGITTPVFKLDVKGGSINTDSLYRISGVQVLKRDATNKVQIGDLTVKVGIGTDAPAYKLHVTESTEFIAASINNTGLFSTAYGIEARTNAAGSGSRIGILSAGENGTDTNIGIQAFGIGGTWATGISATGSGAATSYGVYGGATGTSLSYGLYGTATGTGTNWAGYFDDGNVYVKNKVGIGNVTPAYALDVASNLMIAGNFVNTADNGSAIGVSGHADIIGTGNRYGTVGSGANGIGSNFGFYGTGFGGALAYGMYAYGYGSSASNHGVYAEGSGGTTAYGLRATAVFGITNWAGYFDDGNVYVKNKVGIGNLVPAYTLDVAGNLFTAGNFVNTAASADNVGVRGSCNNTPNFGYGIAGYGGRIGVYATADMPGTGDRYGMISTAQNGATANYGIQTSGAGGTTAFGIYASASGASSSNWAGYFGGGNVFIQNNLGIGTGVPSAPLHVVNNGNSAYACMIMQNLDAAKVSGMQILNNASILKAHMGYGNTGSVLPDRFYAGTISADPVVFTTTDIERMRITAIGRVGIGVTAPGGLFELSLDQGRKPSTNTWTVTSDARLKNIDGIYTKGLKEVLQLNPVAYHYKNAGERKFADEVLKTANVGFIAQEVQKIFPEAVGIDEDGYLNFNMHSILVAYTNAFKEQQQQIETKEQAIKNLQSEAGNQKSDIQELKSLLAQMQKDLSQCCMSSNKTETGSEFGAVAAKLEQNTPNPFSENTIIRFYIPQHSGNGIIKVYSMDGSELISIPVSTKGFSQTEISGKALSAGTYTYILLLDGKVVDTKQMVLTK